MCFPSSAASLQLAIGNTWSREFDFNDVFYDLSLMQAAAKALNSNSELKSKMRTVFRTVNKIVAQIGGTQQQVMHLYPDANLRSCVLEWLHESLLYMVVPALLKARANANSIPFLAVEAKAISF